MSKEKIAVECLNEDMEWQEDGPEEMSVGEIRRYRDKKTGRLILNAIDGYVFVVTSVSKGSYTEACLPSMDFRNEALERNDDEYGAIRGELDKH